MREEYVPPSFKASGFHCAHCGAYAHQEWYPVLYHHRGGVATSQEFEMTFCARCDGRALWVEDKMVYPVSSIAPLPVEDMPEETKRDFMEARDIVNASPRAAAALLRLGLQKLMVHLGEKGENLNDDIASLVKKGLPDRIQKALDAVRVIGNNAVHPGQIDLRDDTQTAIALFGLLNMIVEIMITQPKKVDEIYGKIPNSTKRAIEKRDAGV